MDNSRNMRVISLKSDENLNNICKSFHEGIYSFSKDISNTINNYPGNGISGFLFINTDFDDKYCLQKITTMDQKFYYRTGVYTNGLFVWSPWDSYATLEDIPDSTSVRNEKNYISKEDLLPKRIDDTSVLNPDLELSSILDKYYKYYGKYNGSDITQLANYINNLEGPYKDKNRKFIFGYFIKDEEDTFNLSNRHRVPSGKAGLLQVFSSMFVPADKRYQEYPAISKDELQGNEKYSLFTTFIFTEFETGDIYVTRLFNSQYSAELPDRYVYSPTSRDDRPITWYKYSYSKVRSYNLNSKALDFLRLRNRQFEGTRFTDINSILGDYDNTRNEEYLKNRRYDLMTSFNKSISWNDDAGIAILNTDNGIPYFNNNIQDKDYTLITSLFPTGTVFKYPLIKNDFIYSNTYDRPVFKNNDWAFARYIMPVWNTFNLNYNIIKLTKDRFSTEEIEKEDL